MQRVDRADTISIAAGRVPCPSVRHHTDNVRGGITATQGVARAQRLTTASEEKWVGVLVIQGIIHDDAVEVVGILQRLCCYTRSGHIGRLV